MKHFEEWWKLNQATIRHDNEARYLVAKAAYKEGLEWVLRINSLYSDCNRWCLTLRAISEELNDE